MSRTVYHTDAAGLTLYARPYPASGTWATGVSAGTETARAGADSQYVFAGVADGPGGVYRQAGASPAVGDTEVANYGSGLVTTDAPSRTALTDGVETLLDARRLDLAANGGAIPNAGEISTFDSLTDGVDVSFIEGTDATDVLDANPVLVALAPLIESGAFTAAALANAPASPLSVPQRDALVAAAAVIDTALAGLTKPGTGGGLTLRNDFLPNGNA